MSKEAMKQALNKAFQSWADSEYSSHWKKADAAKAEFDQLVQDTINAALAEQPTPVQGWTPSIPITEEMHRAAYKVLMQANGLDGTPRRMINAMLAAAPQPAQQEPDELRHIGEQDCLLDVDEKAWHSLVENRGGCRCHISPPCGACSNPISEEEMNEVGYTYTSPQPAQRRPLMPNLEADTGYSSAQRAAFKAGWEAAEAAHGIKS